MRLLGIREEFIIINLFFFFALAICQPLALVGLDSLNSLNSLYLLLILLLRLTPHTSPWLPETSLFSNLARASLFVTPVTELGPVPDLFYCSIITLTTEPTPIFLFLLRPFAAFVNPDLYSQQKKCVNPAHLWRNLDHIRTEKPQLVTHIVLR